MRCAVVLSVGVALRALHRRMLAGKGELGMVECSAFPLRGGMAHHAVGGEARGLVVRIGCRVVRTQMTRGAILRCSRVLPVDVALAARG